jgi:hypothetical protein
MTADEPTPPRVQALLRPRVNRCSCLQPDRRMRGACGNQLPDCILREHVGKALSVLSIISVRVLRNDFLDLPIPPSMEPKVGLQLVTPSPGTIR